MKNFLTIVAALARRALPSLQFVFMLSTACQNAMGTSAFLSARNFLKAVNWTGSKRASLKDLTCRIKAKLKLLNTVKQVTIHSGVLWSPWFRGFHFSWCCGFGRLCRIFTLLEGFAVEV